MNGDDDNNEDDDEDDDNVAIIRMQLEERIACRRTG